MHLYQRKRILNMKLVYSFLFSLSVLGATAQIPKFTIMAGGTGQYSSSKTKGSTAALTTLHVSPQIGFFLREGLAVGAKVDYARFSSANSLALAPYVRYFFLRKLYIQPALGFGVSGNNNVTSFQTDLGYALFLNKSVALEPVAFFNYSTSSNFDQTGYGLKIGLQVYFNRD